MTNPDQASDEELLRRARGDAEAFRGFYLRHAERVLGVMASRARGAEDALDLTAETFAQALASVRRFHPEGAGSAERWLMGIARNQLRMYARTHRVQEDARLRLGMTLRWHEDELEEINDRIDAERLVRSGEIAKALEDLSAEQRKALDLRLDDGMPYAEIAESQSVTSEVARSRVSRALAAVRSALRGA